MNKVRDQKGTKPGTRIGTKWEQEPKSGTRMGTKSEQEPKKQDQNGNKNPKGGGQNGNRVDLRTQKWEHSVRPE